ncbi:MAG TPA: SDR family NAD(P)-dependent oxidoreductase [Thermoanaerobaculia bacterium]|nr:SDR family NAD(P)-dependent oxidoreductase [Thermoanaerobaculia bacterium]
MQEEAFGPFGKRTRADEVVRGLDLSGKTMVVTGANVGIGYETARALAAAGARVVLGCRNREAGSRAAQRIADRHPGASAEHADLDLASWPSVRAFAARLDAEQVDALICNAGVINMAYREVESGFEHTVGVCHLGHFLLTRELLPRLLVAGGRVVMVSSESHRSPRTLDFDRLPLPREGYSGMVAYGQAKLCNVLFANDLQRRYGDRGVVACSLHPGTLVTTRIGRDAWWVRLVIRLVSPFTKNAAQGAATSVYCAVHPGGEAIAGLYFDHCAPKRSSREANDPAVAGRLWERSEEWLGL